MVFGEPSFISGFLYIFAWVLQSRFGWLSGFRARCGSSSKRSSWDCLVSSRAGAVYYLFKILFIYLSFRIGFVWIIISFVVCSFNSLVIVVKLVSNYLLIDSSSSRFSLSSQSSSLSCRSSSGRVSSSIPGRLSWSCRSQGVISTGWSLSNAH